MIAWWWLVVAVVLTAAVCLLGLVWLLGKEAQRHAQLERDRRRARAPLN